MTKRMMLRYEIASGVEKVFYRLYGNPVAAVIKPGTGDMLVEFWCEHGGDEIPVSRARTFIVVATGTPIPVNAAWLATTPRSEADHVLHLYELMYQVVERPCISPPPLPEKYGDVVEELRSGAWHTDLPKRGHIEPPVIREAQQVVNDAFNKPGEIHGG